MRWDKKKKCKLHVYVPDDRIRLLSSSYPTEYSRPGESSSIWFLDEEITQKMPLHTT